MAKIFKKNKNAGMSVDVIENTMAKILTFVHSPHPTETKELTVAKNRLCGCIENKQG